MPTPRPAQANATTPSSKSSNATAKATAKEHFAELSHEPPITAPAHSWFTSPVRSHAYGHGRELPLHLIQLILEYLDDAADLARVTRTSRLFYYMTLPHLYEEVTLRTYADIRYVNGRPTGYGSGSPFAMGLNTLVSRNFTDYVQTFRVIGEWREHDVDDYTKGRVPDNSMVLQIAMRAALDKMKNLKTFAWELNTKPLQTVYEGLMQKSSLTTLILRFPARRIPRPTAIVPPLPNLTTLVCYDIDPLSSPDNISLLLLASKKLENLKMHFNPRMRETGEESIQLSTYFGRCLAANYSLNLRRFALYNMLTRYQGEGYERLLDNEVLEEVTMINCGGSSDPMTVFLDDTWRLNPNQPVPENLKMLRADSVEPEQIATLNKFHGLERVYLVNKSNASKINSAAQTPTSPTATTTPNLNGHNTSSAAVTPRSVTESECKSVAGDVLASIQSNHQTMRHLLLLDHWILSDDVLFKLCQKLPRLEQLGFACQVPHMESLRHIISLVPNLWALRLLVGSGSAFQAHIDVLDMDMQKFAFATELWRPEYRKIKYLGLGNKALKLGDVVWPQGKGKARADGDGQGGSPFSRSIIELRRGPFRKMEYVDPKSLSWIEIWGMDSTEFEAKFP
ncbi:hypothetical protein BU23DRAFT_545137 [Bimuria novae-zelandiae CBS 107.79]|uniref:F-box domain-containing protein n=1 Tax=Bimuria novae-zelandiae CBS 107.79 TaxID=1447943 RepID=A0A6A5UXY3_9PLEO|nr:hypothetical protein BU23DRAFT_545137 [Bimuria novae-zelandiae CBS 107.79]